MGLLNCFNANYGWLISGVGWDQKNKWMKQTKFVGNWGFFHKEMNFQISDKSMLTLFFFILGNLSTRFWKILNVFKMAKKIKLLMICRCTIFWWPKYLLHWEGFKTNECREHLWGEIFKTYTWTKEKKLFF